MSKAPGSTLFPNVTNRIALTTLPVLVRDPGMGLHGSPPVDFQNERVFVKSVAADIQRDLICSHTGKGLEHLSLRVT